jgi:hypothetical protein
MIEFAIAMSVIFIIYKIFPNAFDPLVLKIKVELWGKLLVEMQSRNIKRHKIVWVGRSKYDNGTIRIGVRYEGKDKIYFHNLADIEIDDRYRIVSKEQADQLEKQMIIDHQEKKKQKKAAKDTE